MRSRSSDRCKAAVRAIRCGPMRVFTYARDVIARRGNGVICDCCGNASRRFVSFGSPPRPDARCPHCNALERHRVLWPHLRDRIGPGDRVLHFAPEPVIARNVAQIPGVAYTAADLEPQRYGPGVVQADITAQPWPDGSFDVAIVIHVLEHVPDDLAAMRELRRVLDPAGVVVSQHPHHPARESTFEDPAVVTPEDRARTFDQFDHVRVYGRDLPERWERAGFTVEVFPVAGPGATIIQATPR